MSVLANPHFRAFLLRRGAASSDQRDHRHSLFYHRKILKLFGNVLHGDSQQQVSFERSEALKVMHWRKHVDERKRGLHAACQGPVPRAPE